MTKTQLLVRLRDLHNELLSINDGLNPSDLIDEETIDSLGRIVSEVSELVDQANVAQAVEDSSPPVLENHDVVDRIVTFETQHPRVARFLSQVTDLLGMMGI
jgi:hypothetical protein